ncbi:MAG: nuclear transport factor 2 family protein [Acidimicrobiales bacterium]
MPSIEDLAAEVTALRLRVEASEGVLAIQALKARYAALVDARFRAGEVVDAAELAAVTDEASELFTDDAVWDGGGALGVAVGRRAIAERLRNPTLVFSRHFFTNPRIEVTGTTAQGRWDLLSPCRTADGRSWWMAGHEDDEYRREEGRWRCSAMRLTTAFVVPAGTAFDRILS